MNDPIVDPVDLGTYLGADIDIERAELFVRLAQNLCETVVNPLTPAAGAVVLAVAARAYSNPINAQQRTDGPFATQFAQVGGGLWLTESDRASLRSLASAARGGAFQIDTVPAVTVPVLPWWNASRDDELDWL